jgi:hypothetical protein
LSITTACVITADELTLIPEFWLRVTVTWSSVCMLIPTPRAA